MTEHARRKIIFLKREGARTLSRKNHREWSRICRDYIVPLGLTCRPCYRRRTRNLRPVYIHCVRLLRYRSILRLERALISSSSKESACTFACWPCELVLSLFLSADFNANERRRCANMKGGCAERERERECLKSRLMIRDDTRHSSLSDVWLDCRYCSLSFILRELSPPTHAYVRQCVRRIKARRA